MIYYILYLINSLFFLGGVLTIIINRNKTQKTKRGNWLKYFTYFIIVNLIVISIVYQPQSFFYIAILISIAGLIEIVRAIYFSRKIYVGMIAVLIYLPLAFIFVRFAQLDQNILLVTYLIVTIFDAFSQLTGQLFGHTKLVPKISPGKTVEGLVGGIVSTCIISFFFIGLTDLTIGEFLILSFAVSTFSFLGDLIASYCKRKFMIKDFSQVLPGHGGFLDRFDSLIFSSLIITILTFYE